MRSSSFIFIILFLSSCQKDSFIAEPFDNRSNDLVDNRLLAYFNKFETEANKRGLAYDLSALEITGVIENIPEDNVAGTCQYGRHLAHVTVDINYWNNTSELNREMVVFHELGHCVLLRDHEEYSFQNGICASIMNSGTTNCSLAYNLSNREYYLDELFEL